MSPGDEDSERRFTASEKRRRQLEERLEIVYQEKEAELRRIKEETLRIEAMRRELEAKIKADEEQRLKEREVEGTTLQLLRQLLADAV